MCDLEKARLLELDLALVEGDISEEEYKRMLRGDYSPIAEKEEESKSND